MQEMPFFSRIKERATRIRAQPVKATPSITITTLALRRRFDDSSAEEQVQGAFEGDTFTVELSRGKKVVTSQSVAAREGGVRFHDSFSVPCTLYRARPATSTPAVAAAPASDAAAGAGFGSAGPEHAALPGTSLLDRVKRRAREAAKARHGIPFAELLLGSDSPRRRQQETAGASVEDDQGTRKQLISGEMARVMRELLPGVLSEAELALLLLAAREAAADTAAAPTGNPGAEADDSDREENKSPTGTAAAVLTRVDLANFVDSSAMDVLPAEPSASPPVEVEGAGAAAAEGSGVGMFHEKKFELRVKRAPRTGGAGPDIFGAAAFDLAAVVALPPSAMGSAAAAAHQLVLELTGCADGCGGMLTIDVCVPEFDRAVIHNRRRKSANAPVAPAPVGRSAGESDGGRDGRTSFSAGAAAFEALGSIAGRLTTMEEEVASAEAALAAPDVAHTPPLTGRTHPAAHASLAQLHGVAEKVQFTQIDGIQVGGLTAGEAAVARTQRKALNRRMDSLMRRIAAAGKVGAASADDGLVDAGPAPEVGSECGGSARTMLACPGTSQGKSGWYWEVSDTNGGALPPPAPSYWLRQERLDGGGWVRGTTEEAAGDANAAAAAAAAIYRSASPTSCASAAVEDTAASYPAASRQVMVAALREALTQDNGAAINGGPLLRDNAEMFLCARFGTAAVVAEASRAGLVAASFAAVLWRHAAATAAPTSEPQMAPEARGTSLTSAVLPLSAAPCEQQRLVSGRSALASPTLRRIQDLAVRRRAAAAAAADQVVGAKLASAGALAPVGDPLVGVGSAEHHGIDGRSSADTEFNQGVDEGTCAADIDCRATPAPASPQPPCDGDGDVPQVAPITLPAAVVPQAVDAPAHSDTALLAVQTPVPVERMADAAGALSSGLGTNTAAASSGYLEQPETPSPSSDNTCGPVDNSAGLRPFQHTEGVIRLQQFQGWADSPTHISPTRGSVGLTTHEPARTAIRLFDDALDHSPVASPATRTTVSSASASAAAAAAAAAALGASMHAAQRASAAVKVSAKALARTSAAELALIAEVAVRERSECVAAGRLAGSAWQASLQQRLAVGDQVASGRRAALDRVSIDTLRRRLAAAAYRMGGADMAALVRRYDRVGNGSISSDEMGAVLQVLLPGILSVAQRDAIFRHIDKDRSGTIDADELQAFVAGRASPAKHRRARIGRIAESYGLRHGIVNAGVPAGNAHESSDDDDDESTESGSALPATASPSKDNVGQPLRRGLVRRRAKGSQRTPGASVDSSRRASVQRVERSGAGGAAAIAGAQFQAGLRSGVSTGSRLGCGGKHDVHAAGRRPGKRLGSKELALLRRKMVSGSHFDGCCGPGVWVLLLTCVILADLCALICPGGRSVRARWCQSARPVRQLRHG